MALFDRSERAHRRVSAAWSTEATAAVTSDYVFDETVTALKVRVGQKASVAAGEAMLTSPRLSIEPIGDEDRRSAWTIFSTHGDRRWSFTDCTSKVLIDRLECEQVWALDADFRQMGYEVRP